MRTPINVICIVFALVGCSTGATFVKVRGSLPRVSHDSQKVLLSGRDETVMVRDAVSDSLLFRTTFKVESLTDLCWLDDRTFLATLHDSAHVAMDITTNTSKELVKLRGISADAMCMATDQACLYVVDGSYAYEYEMDPKSTVWVYDLELDSLWHYEFNLNLSFTFSLVHLGGDSLILNAGGTLSILDLSTGVLVEVRDSHNNKVDIGDSWINVPPDGNIVVFSFGMPSQVGHLDLSTRELTVVPELAGYICPEVAPNCEFMYVTSPTYPFPAYRVEGLPFLKDACQK